MILSYKEVKPSKDDDLWKRMEKLYVRICSVGDEIYSAGSGVSVLHQRIDSLESSVMALRKEFEQIKEVLLAKEQSCRQSE